MPYVNVDINTFSLVLQNCETCEKARVDRCLRVICWLGGPCARKAVSLLDEETSVVLIPGFLRPDS